jgi:hypothetical protein
MARHRFLPPRVFAAFARFLTRSKLRLNVSFRGKRTRRSCAELIGLVPALAMASNAYFSPATFEFLDELKANNRREWFLANKQRYESEVRGPMLEFIAAFARQGPAQRPC